MTYLKFFVVLCSLCSFNSVFAQTLADRYSQQQADLTKEERDIKDRKNQVIVLENKLRNSGLRFYCGMDGYRKNIRFMDGFVYLTDATMNPGIKPDIDYFFWIRKGAYSTVDGVIKWAEVVWDSEKYQYELYKSNNVLYRRDVKQNYVSKYPCTQIPDPIISDPVVMSIVYGGGVR